MCQRCEQGQPESFVPRPRPGDDDAEAGRKSTDTGDDDPGDEDAEVAAYVNRRCFALLEIRAKPPLLDVGAARAAALSDSLSEATSPSVREGLDRQIDDIGECFDLSLDAIWRSVGSPAGEDPMGWLALACPLVPAFDRYDSNLKTIGCDPGIEDHHPIVYILEDERGDDCWLAGDLMSTTWFLARAYAHYLDIRGLDRQGETPR